MRAIIWPRENKDALPPDFEARLSERLVGRVQRAFLFGSYGTAAFRPGSDVDVILVTSTDLPFVERPRLFDDLYELYPRFDILVYTPEELEAQLAEPTGFWASVKASLRELPLAD